MKILAKYCSFVAFFLLISSVYAELPAKSFFALPDTIYASLSPDGSQVGFLRLEEGAVRLEVLDTASNKKKVVFNTKDIEQSENVKIFRFSWIDNRYLATQLVEIKTGIEDLLDTKINRRLLIIDTQAAYDSANKVKSVRTTGWLVETLPSKENIFYYAKSGYQSKLYQLNVDKLLPDSEKLGKLDKVDGGQFIQSNVVGSSKGYAIRWFVDAEGKLNSVLYINPDKEIVLAKFEDRKETEVKTWVMEGDESSFRYIPVALAQDGQSYYCLDREEEEERSVYLIDFENDNKKLVYESRAFKIVDLLIAEDGTLQAAKLLKNGGIEYDFIGENENNLKEYTKADTLYTVIDQSVDGQLKLIYSESHHEPGKFSLVNNKNSSTRKIAVLYPALENKLKSKLVVGSVNVAGLNIPWLLSLPSGNSGGSHPLIVMPHGGPIGIFDDKYFDSLTQYWVANGYAVLRVNFRGSGGYNTELKEGGKKEWGGKMLDDIVAATIEVVELPYIDANKVCIAGLSYGGYAAAMLSISNPDIFKCGVAISGVYDVNLRIRSAYAQESQVNWMKENIGDPEIEFDHLKQISPVFRASELKVPLFVAHGVKDRNVDIEQAKRFLLMLEKYSKPVKTYIDGEADHSFSNGDQMANMLTEAKLFIDENI